MYRTRRSNLAPITEASQFVVQELSPFLLHQDQQQEKDPCPDMGQTLLVVLGTINFLFDKSFQPYVTVEEINDFFGTNKSSSTGKSKVIRDLLNLAYFDDEFSTSRSKENNPFDRMMMVNGFITFKKPSELRPPEPEIQTEKKDLKNPSKKAKKPLPESTDMDLFAEIE